MLDITDTQGLLADYALLSWPILKGMSIFAAGWVFARFLFDATEKAIKKTRAGSDGTLGFLNSVCFYVVLTVVAVAALSEMGVDTNSMLTVLGGAALAVGLGIKDQLSQLTAGIVLLVKHPFKKGDFVSVSSQVGKVESIDFFQTILKTRDGRKVVLPNNVVASGVIVNYSGFRERRIDLSMPISYHDDISHARQALLRVAHAHPKVLAEPAPDVVVANLLDSGVDMQLRCWVKGEEYTKTRYELLEASKLEVEKSGLTIPFPQLVIHQEQ
ncbi:MAG: mechanosensitive ion channel family protein [Chlamydiia bacterium]|nr:mechanosensitive ion channel family protein [Chlamydiia bacterium]